jgi:hypothetical protein
LKAIQARYEKSDKARARRDRYERSEKGRARQKACNERRIWCGATYYGVADTAAKAQDINQYVQVLMDNFRARQREEYREWRNTLEAIG